MNVAPGVSYIGISVGRHVENILLHGGCLSENNDEKDSFGESKMQLKAKIDKKKKKCLYMTDIALITR